MASIYARGDKLWGRWKDEAGKWVSKPTPYRVGDEAKARRYVAKTAEVLEARRTAQTPAGPKSVADYARKWIADRRALGLASAADDEARMRDHALPTLGALRLDEVRPRHIRDLVLALRKKQELAPRSIRNVYGVLATMFRTAVADELIDASPCVLARGVLPKKVDKDPEWRATAIFTRAELQSLLADERILPDRRVLYALKGVAGLRHAEAAALTWRQYDDTLVPLGALNLGKTKTQVPRRIPVHSTLACLLDVWWTDGWERTYGRAPVPDDLIVPTRNMTVRHRSEAQEALLLDLATLELRHRRGHDLRRTFISLALVDGARRDLLEVVTHGPRGDIISVYSTFPWPALCAEVAKLGVRLPDGAPLRLATAFATVDRRAGKRWRKFVTPPGNLRYSLSRCKSPEWHLSVGLPDSQGTLVPQHLAVSDDAQGLRVPGRP